MARETRCAKGHVYDSNLYASCPYCNSKAKSINFGVGNDAVPSNHLGPASEAEHIHATVAADAAQQNAWPVQAASSTDKVSETHVPRSITNENEAEDGSKTKWLRPTSTQKDPVAGWLVCIEGAEKGKDYCLYARNNTIGRNGMGVDKKAVRVDVSVDADPSISRQQAEIAYDYKANEFYINPWPGCTNLVYLNDKHFVAGTTLKAYDIIEAGKSKFVFVPFCCDKFKWLSDDNGERR